MTQDEVLKEIWLCCGHDDKNEKIIGLWNEYPQYQDYVLTYHNYQVLRHAAEHSEKNFAFFFEKATQAQKEEILPLKEFHAFRVAVLEGRVGSVKLLWESANPSMQEKLLVIKGYHHFGVAFLRPQVKVIEFLWSVANENQKIVILQKLFDNRYASKSREWSLTKLSMQPGLYAAILEIMEKNANESQLALIRQFPHYKVLTKMPQPVTEKPIPSGTNSFEHSPSSPQPLAQKVNSPLIKRIGFYKVEEKKSALERQVSQLFGEGYNAFPNVIGTGLRLRKFTDSTDEENLKCVTILRDAGIEFVIEKSVLGGSIYNLHNETTATLENKLEKTIAKQSSEQKVGIPN